VTRTRLLAAVDASWLAALRILLGLTLCVSMLRFLANGWVDELFVEPTYFFKYWGFSWVQPLSGTGMHTLFAALALLGATMAAGLAFRLSAVGLALGLSYVQLIDATNYLNHYYLAALLTWLLAFSPAHRVWSVDAWLAARRAHEPSPPRGVARAWLYLFRFQVGLVYFFAGMAKAQSDWLLHAQPLRTWLGACTHLPLVGPLFTVDAVPLVMSWAGFLFDTTIVAFLLQRRTRPWAYLVVLLFHACTGLLFPIGMFPVIMTGAALVFFDADWPRALLARLRTTAAPAPSVTLPASPSWRSRLALAAMALYCAVQVALPLRFLAYGGNVLWHEQGMRYSWRVMLRAKGGHTTFIVRNKDSGHVWHVGASRYLNGLQESEMSSQPDLILALARHIQSDFARRGLGPVEVRAESFVTLNGRRAAPLIDPSVDLSAEHDGLGLAHFVLPAPTSAPQHTRPVL
jgi:vitamin K-dependent gamma-carboxylase